MDSMMKSILGTHDNGSEVSSGSKRKSKRRDGDEEEGSQVSRRRGESTGTKRKSSRRDSADPSNDGFHPTSTSFSSSSRSPYADVAAPSVASSYATAYTEPANAPMQRPEVVRNESMAEKESRKQKTRGDDQRDRHSDLSRSIDDGDSRRNAGQDSDRRQESRRKPSRRDTGTRAAEDHDNSLPSNQFPGQEPSGFGVASPYRPPGLASVYYGDHGESVSDQPGVRPNQPSALISADQAHLHEPTVEARPPTEPSSVGKIGAAASFYGGGGNNEQSVNSAPSRTRTDSSQKPGRRPSLKPGKDSTVGGASPRSSPAPGPGKRPLSQSNASGSIGAMGAGAAPLAAGAMAAGVGAAAEYYTGNIAITPHDQPLSSGIPGQPDVIPGTARPPPSSVSGSQSQSYHTTSENAQTTSNITSSSRPPRQSQSSSSNLPLYGAAATAFGVAGAAYLAHEHTSAQHEQFVQSPTQYQTSPNMPFRPGQNQSQASFPNTAQQQRMRSRPKGALGRFIDWFQDPAAIAEYEAYTVAIGVCKYCFDPNSSPLDAPRKHYYRRRRPSSGSRYGSSTRVDKLTRYSSDENLRRRNSKKGYSTTEKVLATGLAGVGAAAVANEVYNHKNDFDDTYSVKSGRPDNRSRVSFQETEEERYSTSKRKSRPEVDGASRRDSDRRRQSGSNGGIRYEKHSSRRRDSSGSDNRATSRGGNLSTPVALAGAAAVGAALTSSGTRRKSRSRSKSPRRNRKGYYSTRVSDNYSYVDLNQTITESPTGPLGLGDFFSSPSSNSKKGKKKKGLFNFNNSSSSSSDADLAFGEGTIKRKDSRRGRQDKRRSDGQKIGDTAAILGLAATGAALSAETNRRDDRGKRKEGRKTDSNRYEDRTAKTKISGYEDSADNGDEGVWEDASDDDADSIDSGLAYGGRLSSRQSKESLSDSTNILGWRFGGKSQKEKDNDRRLRRESSKPDLTSYDPVKAGLIAGAVGAAGVAATNHSSRKESSAIESPPKNMPPLQYMDPVPLDNREQTPRKDSFMTSVSPLSYPQPVTRTSEASLKHPQPVAPISRDVYQARQSYTDGPSGPVVFDSSASSRRQSQTTGVIAAGALTSAAMALNSAEREGKRDDRRSDTTSTMVPSPKESVSFDLTKEQEEREKRRERKRREKEAARAARDAEASKEKLKGSIITGPERSPERKLETWRLRDAVKAAPPGEPPIRDAAPSTLSRDLVEGNAQTLPTPERETRLSEIDRQLEELYAEHRRQEAKKKGREIETAAVAAGAVAVGAGVIAAASNISEKEDQKPRRKSSLRKSSKYRDQDVETESAMSARSAPSDSTTETASERLARKAARRVQNQRAPSPVHEHDKYDDFFVPDELKGRVKEHNREADQREDFVEAKIVDIVPGMTRADTFPDDLYHAYGTEDTDVPPTKLPWKVPMLELVSPTPPPRSPSFPAEASPIILPVSGSRDVGERDFDDVDPRDVEPRRSNSKVTWGDHEINVYEVVTPEYERDGHDFTASPAATKESGPTSPLRQSFTVDSDDQAKDKDMEQPVPPVEKMTKEQREHVAMGKDFADLPPSRDISQEVQSEGGRGAHIEERKPSAATPTMQFEQIDGASTMSDGSFYQSPFASTVSDLDLPVSSSSSRVLADGPSFVAGEVSTTPREEVSEERASKSQKRRQERAEAAFEPRDAMTEKTTAVGAETNRDVGGQHMPGGFDDTTSGVNVFDYMVTSNGSTLPSASVLGTAATSVIASDIGKGASNDRDMSPAGSSDFSKPKRTETFDEEAFVDSFNTPKRAETFAEGDFTTPKSKSAYISDPEDWEKISSSAKTTKTGSRNDDDFYKTKKPSFSKDKSKRSSRVLDDDLGEDARSVVSSPANVSRTKSKRKTSKADSNGEDDDTRSVASDTKSAASEPINTSKGRSKDSSSSTPKKSGWALLGGLIGTAAASKSDVSKSDSSRKSKSDSSDKKQKSSKTLERNDSVKSVSRRSRSASQSSRQPTRDESVDDAFVSADENGLATSNENGHVEEKEMGEDPFLVTRPELPTGSIISESEFGASGPSLESTSIPTAQLVDQAAVVESATRDLDAPEAKSAVSAAPDEHQQPVLDESVQPRQGRLSSLRTTDLTSSPSTSSPRAFGRFPVSPGLIRTGSVGSPPTGAASSPLSASRTRQGRPTSSDFRSGKEFRPLYLVERHSATKVPTQEEEETYPSLPSSRTSSAHPSLENLRSEYSDGDVDVSPQRQTREIGRRNSWSDTRPRSPEFLDSGAATPTQSSFPEQLSRETKEKPKYEFHSPSELLEDPSRHQDAAVPEADFGSPLPSAVETERSWSPVTGELTSDSRSRSSSTKDIGLGIGVGVVGGAAGALAVSQLVDRDNKNRAPASREVEVNESKEKDDFELQPVSSKKSKKDRKRKEKALDLAEEDSEVQDTRAILIVPDVVPATTISNEEIVKPPKKSEDGQHREVTSIDEPGPLPTESTLLASEETLREAEDKLAMPNKKSKKDKKGKKSQRQDTLPLLSTSEPKLSTKEEIEKPVAETEQASAQSITAIADDTSRDLSQFPPTLDATDETAQLDEKVSQASFPFEEASSVALPTRNDDDLTDNSNAGVIAHATQVSAFEAAFDAARAARGMPEGVSKESAMDKLVAPATGILPKSIDIQDVKSDDKNPLGDDYEIGTPRELPGSFGQDRNPFGDDFEVAPEDEVIPTATSAKGNLVEVLPSITEASTPMHSSHDLGEEVERHSGESIPTVTEEGIQKQEFSASADVVPEREAEETSPSSTVEAEASKDIEQSETPSTAMPEQSDEVAWASMKKSKKDKKSKKKSKTFDDFDASTPETGTQTPDETKPVVIKSRDIAPKSTSVEPALEPVAETKQIVQTAQEQPLADSTKSIEQEAPPEPAAEDELDWAPMKKSKKDKKSKKKSKTFDDFEASTPETGTQTPDETKPVVFESRDIAPKSTSVEPALEPVAETKQIVHMAQEQPLADSTKSIEQEAPPEPAAEDELDWAPTKKSKKDKKSKKKSKVFDDVELESDTPEPSSQLPTSENKTREMQESAQASDDQDKTAFVDEPPTTDTPAEDERTVPTKKSKKAKKAKRKTLDLSPEEPAASSQASEPRELGNDESTNLVATSTVTLATGALAGLAGTAVLDADEAKPAEEDEWAATPDKKTKKDKNSKKKGKSFPPAEDDESTPATSTPEPGREAPEILTAEEPVAVDEAERHATFADKLSAEPETEVGKEVEIDREAPVEDDEWVEPMKKAKKDKRSKKKQSLATFEEEQAARDIDQSFSDRRSVDQQSGTANTGDFPASTGAIQIDDVTNHYFGMLRDYRPASGAPDNKALGTRREALEGSQVQHEKAEPSATEPEPSRLTDASAQAAPSQTPGHDFPVSSEVVHVNDIVEYHYGMLRDYKPSAASTDASKEIAEPVVAVASAIAVEAAPIVPEEDKLAVPVKTSKKDKKKKKRQSAFEDRDEQFTEQSKDTSENELTIPVAAGFDATALGAGAEVASGDDPEAHRAESEDVSISPKKSKTDKKKRQSMFDDQDTGQPASDDTRDIAKGEILPTAESPNAELALKVQEEVTEAPTQSEDPPLELSVKKSKKDKKKKRASTFEDFDTAPSTSTDDITQAVPAIESFMLPESRTKPTESSAHGDEREIAVLPTKSKKDKKKSKTFLSWEDPDVSTSQPTETSTPAEPREARDVQMQENMHLDEKMTIKPDTAPAVVPGTMPIVVGARKDDTDHEMRLDRHRSRSVPGGWGDEDDDQLVDEPAMSTSEAKKLLDEPVQADAPMKDSITDRDAPEVEEVPTEQDMGYLVKKTKKDKKGKKSRKSEAVEEAPASRELDEAQEEVPEVAKNVGLEEPVVNEETPEEAAENEWGFTSKKDKKDKKNKKSRNTMEVVAPEEEPEGGILTIPEASHQSSSRGEGGEDWGVVPIKKSKKDKKSKRQSNRDTLVNEQPEEPSEFPINDPAHIDDIAGHYHGMLRDYQPSVRAPDNKSSLTSRGHIIEPDAPPVDDVTGHYFGMLRDYQPATGAPDNKIATLAQDPEQALRSERASSPYSDEDTRRARRVRRKASPSYGGEEPDDLPGNRSLTPPAEHDDMMTTALGVAAGLGLSGAAASAAPRQSDDDGARGLGPEQQAAPQFQAPGWSFAKINAPDSVNQPQRDSGVQFADSPTLPIEQFSSRNRDSGYVRSPANRESWSEEGARDTHMLGASSRPPRPQSPTSSSEDVSGKRSKRISRDLDEVSSRRQPSPVHSTSKDRSSKLFHSSPPNPAEQDREPTRLDTAHLSHPQGDIHRSPSIHGHHRSREELRALAQAGSTGSSDIHHEQYMPSEQHRSIFGPHTTDQSHDRDFPPPQTPLRTISEHSQDTSPSLGRPREVSDVGSEGQRSKRIQHQESGHNLSEAAGLAGAAGLGAFAAKELSRDEQPASRTKLLGKSKANTKSARSLRRAAFDPSVVPLSVVHDPSAGRGNEAVRDMSDVYDGHGEYPGSPMSPTRPPSMRKRQSMQQIRDLETRLDQLAAENRSLAEAKVFAERHLEDFQLEQHKSGYAGQEAVESANVQLREKDEDIARLQQELDDLKQDHARLSEVNAGMSDAHENLRTEHEQRYSQLEDQHAEAHQNWQEKSRELDTLKGQHTELSGGMEDIVRHEIDTALAEKNAEIERLQSDLGLAKQKINELEQQILSGGADNILDFKDEDYFENACQSLCQHVQQWVLRFSKFSDTLVCRTTNQIRDEKLVDRFDLAILDGSDVDAYLTDRIKRRDVFMSVVMTMIFEYVFTRYLFGMDRDQRQTLKKLEKNLSEVGPPGAVHQWRAMTLTLLAKREAFKSSRENDTEAVVLQIYDTLSRFLPPPQNLQAQVQESLRNVMRTAVDLSIEMRTQKAEYIMLPPLQPEYDTNGDLSRKVYFNASLMNERSGETSSNDELEAQQAVVRMVLFPLVVKKGNDDGEGEEEIVVCPAQVLVARPDRKSKANSGRVVSGQSDRMSVDQMSRGNASRHSLAPSTMDMTNVI